VSWQPWAKPVVGKYSIERVTVRVVERHRGRRVFVMVHDQFEEATAEFVGERGPVAFDTVPRANRGKRRPHAGMPVKNGAAGIETKCLDIAHDVIPPFANVSRVGDGSKGVPDSFM
jgi:hypothetical protein